MDTAPKSQTPISFHGHEVPSIRAVVSECVDLGCSPLSESRTYLGWNYSTLIDRVVAHINSLPPEDYEPQYSQVCELCQEYINKIEVETDAGQKARIILEDIIHPCFRTDANDSLLRKACECYTQLNSTRWYIADVFAELLITHSEAIIRKELLPVGAVDAVTEDWAYSDDERKRRHAVSLIKAFYSASRNKRALERALDILSQSEPVNVQAKKVASDLGILEKRERRKRLIRTIEVMGILLGIVAALITILQFLVK